MTSETVETVAEIAGRCLVLCDQLEFLLWLDALLALLLALTWGPRVLSRTPVAGDADR